ncbi:hypothetical protein AURDEDRAFT_170949 [Auricularia subglabra TFB-10046 SS5]|nr:hypothetical protein AURDEDRAFT_170949 [Auricularia subglabra TFB-10046 SS5]
MARSKRQKTGPASVARWEKEADVPLDAQEQFHAQRDRILLEGDDAADDDFDDDDEVFALRGVGDDDDSDDNDDQPSDGDSDEDEPEPAPKTKAKSKSKGNDHKKTKTAAQQSDASESDSEEDEGWGRKKSAYYADDAVDSDDDEANELQEAEVRRVQAKARAALTDDDFGLADLRISEPAADPDAVAPAAPPPQPQDLARQSPETLALAREWDDVAHALQRAARAVEKTQAADPDALSLGLLHVHHQTLLTYATTLAFYFRLRTAERYRVRPELLREHPVLQRLLVLKQALSTLEDLDFGADSDDDEDESESDDLSTDADLDEDDEKLDAGDDDDDGWKQLELAELLADSKKYGDVDTTAIKRKRRVKPAAPPPLELPRNNKAKSKSKTADAKQVFDLVEPTFVSSKAPRLPTVAEVDEFGDPVAMQAADAADKKARRHTLRFHAAKIESASARRKGKRAELGGDEDVPYPERRKDREKRQAEELERRRAKLGQGGDDLDGEEEPEQEQRKKRRRDEDEDEDGMDVDQDGDEDGYYQLVAGTRKAAKKAKKEQYDAERAAERVVEDDEGTDGPRALTRAILKNKGLTPKRAKSVRNPRVKKRLRYEKAQKRVASQRAVFKGGLAGSKGVYEGEHSGINPRVVKSTRLG